MRLRVGNLQETYNIMAKPNKEFKQRLYSYYISKLGAFPYKHGWLKVNTCPLCGDDRAKFGINIGYNRTNCFVCEGHPSAIQLAMDLEGFLEFRDFLTFLTNEDFTYFEYKEEVVELKAIRSDTILPEGYKLIEEKPTGTLGKSATRYLKKRGFDINKVKRKRWGYCNTGDFFGHIILPIYYEGKLVYYNARRFIGTGPKYKNPNIDDVGVGKSFIIYNREALFMYKKVYLCEGIFNAETVSTDQGISTSGKALSRYQINDILKSPVEQVVIILDPDAIDKAIQVAQELCYYKKVKIIILPDETDPNDLGRRATMKIIRETPFLTYSDITTLKNKIITNERTIHTY